ncbi:MAG: Zonular occludens toxin [Variovorax paradoxus]|uniref:Zonular occludens toxin n=1 Tax=Variovorax paradoxus TaxID=34073 RepID=A0A2W5QJ95_VARPD|nr:MAG: Zonular occludens toxin [Variovorax paradoxus]
MAILFYEGLPRAGKSYESMVEMIIPWLKKGREVVAYVEGLDFDRIAEAAELSVDQVRELLFPLTREDMRPREEKKNGKMVPIDGAWIEKTRDNALHVFDEAQTWWPNRMRATEALTQFVTEHGHRGMTVLLMGQSLDDVLALWRRRVDQKMVFLKLSALGQANRYSVTTWKGLGGGDFAKVGTKVRKYDPKYFGTYSSHTSDDIDTETFTDERANAWKSGGLRFAFSVVIVCVVFGVWKGWGFFHQQPKAQESASKPNASAGPQQPAGGVQKVAVRVDAPQVQKTPQERYFLGMTDKYRIRLAGVARIRERSTGVVEWIDGNTRVVERMTFETLGDLGVSVVVTGSTARLALGTWSELATSWPLEEQDGRVSQSRQEAIRGTQPADVSSGPRLTVIGDGKSLSPPKEPAVPVETQQKSRVPASSPWSFSASGRS